jgi:hypothetical protein
MCHTEAMGHANVDAVTNKLVISGHARPGVSIKASENNYYNLSAS